MKLSIQHHQWTIALPPLSAIIGHPMNYSQNHHSPLISAIITYYHPSSSIILNHYQQWTNHHQLSTLIFQHQPSSTAINLGLAIFDFPRHLSATWSRGGGQSSAGHAGSSGWAAPLGPLGDGEWQDHWGALMVELVRIRSSHGDGDYHGKWMKIGCESLISLMVK